MMPITQDLTAHAHICPHCSKEHFCTLDDCTNIPHVLCEECKEEFCDFT